MVQINSIYKGNLRFEATHGPSGTTLITDAPVDNHGKGESFSPTDLVATALGTCILTTMAIVAKLKNIDMGEAKINVKKEMAASPPRRISAMPMIIEIPTVLTEEQKQILIKAAEGCPVKQSLHPDVKIEIEYRWAS